MEEAGRKVPTSVGNLMVALRYYRTILVQDALELAPQYPNHPVHRRLMQMPEFRELLASYEANKAAKVQGRLQDRCPRCGGEWWQLC